jgi:hypothetical protein
LERLFDLHWRGDLKVQLRPIDVKGSVLENRIKELSFLNYAFALFYAFRQGIARCSDPKMRERMTQTLEAAAQNGSGHRECDDLRGAIYHAIALKVQNGHQAPYQWQNNKLETYQSVGFDQPTAFAAIVGRPATVWQEGDVVSAKAAVRFLAEIDGYVGLLQRYFARIEERWRLVHRAGMGVRQPQSELAATDWNMLGSLLGSISRTVFDSQDAMWLSVSEIDQRFSHAGRHCLGSETNVLGVARRIEALAARMLKGNAVIINLRDAMEALCVLATFYARAFEMIPGAQAWISGIAAHRWNEVQLFAHAAQSMTSAEVRTGRAYSRGQASRSSFPQFGHYCRCLSRDVLDREALL